MDPQLCLIWQPCPEGACLIRVLGETPCPVLPASMAGHALTQIGAYCFAPTPRPVSGPVFATLGGTSREYPNFTAALTALSLPEIAGSFLQSVLLPDSVQQIDNAAFYNCRSLQTLSFGPALRRLGSDCFTNCFSLQTLVLRAHPGQPSGLGKVLARISAPITTEFFQEKLLARLFFPEYADDNPENGPAHIFMHEFQGVGYLFRQCFALDGTLRFSEYDACLPRAQSMETPEIICKIALNRLRFPVGLSEETRRIYAAACRENADALAAWLLAEKDLAALEFACREALFPPDALACAAALAARQNQPQAAALLLRSAAPAMPQPKRYDFDF